MTDRCNFRCGYCMPADSFEESHFLPHAEILSFEEILRLARVFTAELGVSKLRLTGGEPLLRRELSKLVTWLAELPGASDLALTTNGFLLADQARALREAGLRRITVSLDSLDPAEFARMSGGGETSARARTRLSHVLEGIDAAVAAGFAQLKINCVVIAGQNEGAVLALAERFRGTPHIVRFIEYMDVGTQNHWRSSEVISAAEIVERISAEWPLEPVDANHRGEVARRFRYRDGRGEIGVISSVSQPFCGDCQRARLSSDGRFLTCLFAQSGVDLKRSLRGGASDADLRARIESVWAARSDRYSELRAAPAARSRRRLEMYQVGG